MRRVLLALAICSLCFAAKKEGHDFPEKLTVESKNLMLNGLGMRLATFFNVKVYVGALYLENKSSDASAIIASKESKMVRMAFVRDVEADKIRGAWKEGLKSDNYKASLDKLNSYMEDMKDMESMRVVFHADSISVYVKGKLKGKIPGADFARDLLNIFIGSNPPNEELRDGMLGK